MAVAAPRGVKFFIVTFWKTVTATKPIWSDKYTPTEDLILNKVIVRDTSGESLNKCTLSLSIGKATLSIAADVNVFGTNGFYAMELDEPAPTNIDITWTLTNNEGVDKDVMLSLVFKRAKEAAV